MSAQPKPLPALRSPEWLAYVRSLPSVVSGMRGCCAHHPVGHGRLSTLKVSDFFAIPLTDAEHKALHDGGWMLWEQGDEHHKGHGEQYEHARATLEQGIRDGVLNWRKGAYQPPDMQAWELEVAIQRGDLVLDKRAARFIAA